MPVVLPAGAAAKRALLIAALTVVSVVVAFTGCAMAFDPYFRRLDDSVLNGSGRRH